MKMLDDVIFGDVQACESMNSMVKLQCERSPNISLELLSSRLALKKNLFDDPDFKGKDRRTMRTTCMARAASIVNECVDHEAMTKTVAGDPDRFSLPASCIGMPDTTDVNNKLADLFPGLRLTPALLWAARFNAVWHKSYKD